MNLFRRIMQALVQSFHTTIDQVTPQIRTSFIQYINQFEHGTGVRSSEVCDVAMLQATQYHRVVLPIRLLDLQDLVGNHVF